MLRRMHTAVRGYQVQHLMGAQAALQAAKTWGTPIVCPSFAMHNLCTSMICGCLHGCVSSSHGQMVSVLSAVVPCPGPLGIWPLSNM